MLSNTNFYKAGLVSGTRALHAEGLVPRLAIGLCYDVLVIIKVTYIESLLHERECAMFSGKVYIN